MQLGNERAIDLVELADRFFCTALRTELFDQRGGQGRKAGDVGKEDGAVGAVGQVGTRAEGVAAIHGDVCAERIHLDDLDS